MMDGLLCCLFGPVSQCDKWGTVDLQLKQRRSNKKFLWTSLLSLKEAFIIAKSHSREWKMGMRIVTCLHPKGTRTNTTTDLRLMLLFSAVFLLAVYPPVSYIVDTSQNTLGSQHRRDPLLPEHVQHSPASPCSSGGGPCISSLTFSTLMAQLLLCTSPALTHIAPWLSCTSRMLLPLVLS